MASDNESASPGVFLEERRRRLMLLLKYAKELHLNLWCTNAEIKLRTRNEEMAIEVDVIERVRVDIPD